MAARAASKTKGRSTFGVLFGQKPQKSRRKAHRSRQFIKWGLITSCFLATLSFVWMMAQRPLIQKVVAKIHWQIDVRSTSGDAVSEEQARRIVKIAGLALRTGEENELRAIARQVQQNGQFAKVHVLRTAQSSVAVSVSERKPVMAIEADKLRQLTAEGVVYGEQGDSPALPIIRGVFDNRAEEFALAEDQSLRLTDDERQVIRESIELWGDANRAGFSVKSLEYRRFRGFFVTLTNSDIEVALGRTPFVEKFGRLQEILKRLEKSGGHAARIELDYQGKAFIKEKKM
jgi:hypothetical protein